MAAGLCHSFDDAIRICEEAGYPVEKFDIALCPRTIYSYILGGGKVPIITEAKDLPEGPGLDVLIKGLKMIRRELKKVREEGGCSCEELGEFAARIDVMVKGAMPPHIEHHQTFIIERARDLFNKLVWIPPLQQDQAEIEELKRLVAKIGASGYGGHEDDRNGSATERPEGVPEPAEV